MHSSRALRRADAREKILEGREKVLASRESYFEQRKQDLIETIAQLENVAAEKFREEARMIRESGLPEARAELEKLRQQIAEEERKLKFIKSKVKVMDQFRMLEGADGSGWNEEKSKPEEPEKEHEAPEKTKA